MQAQLSGQNNYTTFSRSLNGKMDFSVIEANTRNRPALLSFRIAALARSNALVYFSPSFFMLFFPGVRAFSPARYIVSRPKRISTVLA